MLLRMLLQKRFEIGRKQPSLLRQMGEHMLLQKNPYRFQTLIQIQGADKRLEHICEQCRTGSPPGQLFSFAEQHISSKIELFGKADKRGLADDRSS
ncbi:Uncharacterised protein [Mycobacterium tuberculosis]|nr:Uncharacterised protein [Mycobacterium tuberculosis]